MSKSKVMLALALALTILPTGCASIMSGGQPSLNVEVEEPSDNVEVIIRGLNNGERIVRRSSNFTVPLSRSTKPITGPSKYVAVSASEDVGGHRPHT